MIIELSSSCLFPNNHKTFNFSHTSFFGFVNVKYSSFLHRTFLHTLAMSKHWCSISTYTSTYHYLLVISFIFNLSYFCDIVICGSCLEAKLCCPGRDSSCIVQRTLVNSVSVLQDYYEKPCYCDHACLRLGDCCVDFKKTCNGKYDNANAAGEHKSKFVLTF